MTQHANDVDVLHAICDVMVVKTLERVGAYIVRSPRSRRGQSAGIPQHEIHTVWADTDLRTAKAIGKSWEPFPALLARHTSGFDADLVRTVITGYIHDLVVSGTPHNVDEMRTRLRDRAGIGGPRLAVDLRTGALLIGDSS